MHIRAIKELLATGAVLSFQVEYLLNFDAFGSHVCRITICSPEFQPGHREIITTFRDEPKIYASMNTAANELIALNVFEWSVHTADCQGNGLGS